MTARRSFGPVHNVEILVALRASTADAGGAVQQVVGACQPQWAALASVHPRLTGFDKLYVGLAIHNPLAGQRLRLPSGRYHAPTHAFHASGDLDYSAWVGADWQARVHAVSQVVHAVVQKISRTRITDDERLILHSLISEGAQRASRDFPEALVPLGAVYLQYGADGTTWQSTSFEMTSTAFTNIGRIVEVMPAEAVSESGRLRLPVSPAPKIFKLYRRVSGHLEYREAWYADDHVIEHWGQCGQRGEFVRHPVGDIADAASLMIRLKAEAKVRGFRAIPPSRQPVLVVEGADDGTVGVAERHALEDFLDQRLGWVGLGHCDGGSSGSGSMDVFCPVVDAMLAIAFISKELAESPYNGFSVRRWRGGA